MKALLSSPLNVSKSCSPRKQFGEPRYFNSLRTDDIPGAHYQPRHLSPRRPTYSLVTSDIGAVPRAKEAGPLRNSLCVQDIPGACVKTFRRAKREVPGRLRDHMNGLIVQETEKFALPPINQSVLLSEPYRPSPRHVKGKRSAYHLFT